MNSETPTLHAEVIPTTNRKILNHYKGVLNQVCLALKDKGMTSIKTFVYGDENYRYANFFGFKGTGNEIVGPALPVGVYELERML